MARLWVIGNVNADEVVRLDAPPWPGAHLAGRPQGVRLGGGGANAAVALALAGHGVTLHACVGDDPAGADMVAACRARGLDVAGLRRLPGRATTRHLILIDPDGERTLIANRTITPADLDPPPTDDGTADGLLVKTFAPRLAPLMASVAVRAPVVAHAPPPDMAAWPATVWVTSETEATAVDPSSPWVSARAWAGGALRWVVVTRGADGAEAYGPDGAHLRAPAHPVARVVDATGAGDVFAAGLLDALVGQGADAIAPALDHAGRWAARTIQADGSIPPDGLCRA
jgi:sugar/nucleoside kinase (ribokinase family)